VPIRYITPDEDDSLEDGGYVIDMKRFKMPEVRLTPRRESRRSCSPRRSRIAMARVARTPRSSISR